MKSPPGSQNILDTITTQAYPAIQSRKFKRPNRFQIMNESNPEAAPVQSIPPPSYKDRSTGLTIFGILTLLLGGLCVLLVLMMLAGPMTRRRRAWLFITWS